MKPDIEAIKARNLDNATLQIAVRGDVLESSKDISALLAYIDSLERVREAAAVVRSEMYSRAVLSSEIAMMNALAAALAAAEGGK